LDDFGVPHSTPFFGDIQHDLVGDVDSDPISVAAGLAVASGWLTYINSNNNLVRFMSYDSFITKQAVATANHIVEVAGITQPTLDKLVIVGTTKNEVTDKYKKQTTVETSLSVNGNIEEQTTTTIDPETGNEESETVCMMKLLRPDTHPRDAQLVNKEKSSKTVYSDRDKRITGYLVETYRNTAMISPETTNSILIRAEQVEFSSNFNSNTSEIITNVETTYQVHIVGRLQLVVFKPSGLERKKVAPPKQLSNDDGSLTEEEENTQYITPLVLTKRVTTSYNKIGSNSWRERVTVSERQFVSKTTKTNGAKNETQEVRVLGGMKTTQSSSRIVNSVPTAQTIPNAESEFEDEVTSITLFGDTVPSICGNKRKERIELSGIVSSANLHDAGKLQAIPRLNKKIAYSLIVSPATTKLISIAFSKLATSDYNLMPLDITLEHSSSGVQLAGTFVVVSNATRDIPPLVVPPPTILGTGYPVQQPSLIDSTPSYGEPVAKPLRPTGGTLVFPSIEEDDDYWYVDEGQPTIDGVVWETGNPPVVQVERSNIVNDTIALYEYSSSYNAYLYDTTTTVQPNIDYVNYYVAYTLTYR
jgi:hypothetical protein